MSVIRMLIVWTLNRFTSVSARKATAETANTAQVQNQAALFCGLLKLFQKSLNSIFLDINECLNNTLHTCHGENMHCENQDGGFECKCDEGFKMAENNECQGG